MRAPKLERAKGFTLIELLIVIAIIAVLIALLVPAVQKVREAAARTQCANNLHQIGVAVHNYHAAEGMLPPARLNWNGGASWAVLILPYIEQGDLYKEWDLFEFYYVQAQTTRETKTKHYFCPTRRTPSQSLVSISGDVPDTGWPTSNHYPGALGDYACCVGDGSTVLTGDGAYNTAQANGAMILGDWKYQTPVPPYRMTQWRGRTRFASIVDGLSNTLLIGEKHVQDGKNGQGGQGDGSIYNGDPGNRNAVRRAGLNNPLAINPKVAFADQFGSSHPGIVQFVMCDGGVRSLPVGINVEMLRRLAVRHDGEFVPIDF